MLTLYKSYDKVILKIQKKGGKTVEIIKSSELTKSESYKLTHSNEVIPVKKLEDNTEFIPVSFVLYRDINSKGEETEILSIKADNGEIYACQSMAFKRNFFDMVDTFGISNFKMKKISGLTKSDREFVNCEFIEEV